MHRVETEFETPVDGPTARKILSPSRDPEKPMSVIMYSAILGAMGISGARLVFVSEIVKFLKKNPNFSVKGHYNGSREWRLGEEIHGRSLPHGSVYEIVGVKDGKPSELKLKPNGD